eukprot:TRINITY_DN112578_c0_g1_i1.p1 TRINITY_DN112578_c0_g1~~TRINITY_DN112578_c0_g1_i1.p1  ORF type:complete len:272 (-),score=63.70 TRINITY_DN112578_c0_g1_i1:27-806(-)
MEPRPQPISDDALRSSIAERFAGAYEAQLGHLTRQAEQERRAIQADVQALRHFAYQTQHQAAEHRARVQAARQTLGQGTVGSQTLREALNLARSELAAEGSALVAKRAALGRDEQSVADLMQRAQREAADLTSRWEAAQQWERQEEQVASRCAEEIVAAQTERETELKAAHAYQQREREALAARERAVHDVRCQDEVAKRTLREAVQTLEADFARERNDFAARDRQLLQQIHELEQRLDARHQAASQLRRLPSQRPELP